MLKLKLSQVVQGFFLAQEARQLSASTLSEYRRVIGKLREQLGDVDFNSIEYGDINEFLLSLAEEREVAGIAPRVMTVKNKTLLNYHTALSALWRWAMLQHLTTVNLMHQIERQRPDQMAVIPFTQEDCRRLLDACMETKPYRIPGRAYFETARPTAVRDRTMLLLLLDTGMRASELCGLKIADTDLSNRRAKVWGKGNKERYLPFCPAVGQAIWMYLNGERKEKMASESLFLSRTHEPLTRHALLQLCGHLGDRAGVSDCFPHRFRHTFAITYLRNGATLFDLQAMLGHASLKMVRRYLAIAQSDIDRAHRTASPVENWRLSGAQRRRG